MVASKSGNGSGRVPLPKLPTLAGRSTWYTLRILPLPPIFFGRIIDREIRVYENGAEGMGRGEPHTVLDYWLKGGGTSRVSRMRGTAYLALDTHIHFVPHARAHTGAFLAYLASSYFALDMEKSAAPLGGGGLRIDNRVLARAKVPAFDRLLPKVVQDMEEAWSEYCATLDRERLDESVFAALGKERHLGAVWAELGRLVDRRRRATKPTTSRDA